PNLMNISLASIIILHDLDCPSVKYLFVYELYVTNLSRIMSSITAQQTKLDLELMFLKCTCINSRILSTSMEIPTELGHTGEIKTITDIVVDQMHQPWRTFATIINQSLSGNTTGLDKLRLSRAHVLWGMYYKKNVDYELHLLRRHESSRSLLKLSIVLASPWEEYIQESSNDEFKRPSQSIMIRQYVDKSNLQSQVKETGMEDDSKTEHDLEGEELIRMMTVLKDKTEGDEYEGMDYTTNQFDDDVIMPKEVSNFSPSVIKSIVTKSLEHAVLAKESSQPKSTYEATAIITEFELKKILIDKMDKSQSYLTAAEHKECYEGLIKSYDLDKSLFSTYDKVYSLKRS
ncbi:hypothetical protein Tco_0884286, partial [Tanacetum coccineum]